MEKASVESKQQGKSVPLTLAPDNDVIIDLGMKFNTALSIPQLDDGTPPHSPNHNILICDAGYGFPREKRPLNEKLNAISSQLANFLQWQQQQQQQSIMATTTTTTTRSNSNCTANKACCSWLSMTRVQVVACPNETIRSALESKLLEKLNRRSSSLPDHVTISCQRLEDCLAAEIEISSATIAGRNSSGDADDRHRHQDEVSTKSMMYNDMQTVYLSPDADESLDPCQRPPRIAIVGLLIDRRIQPNRSKERASKLLLKNNDTTTSSSSTTSGIVVAKRWPLEDCFVDINAKEPLNVDCIMEGMQQWWWNYALDKAATTTISSTNNKEHFVHAASQAIQHHAERHPSRPLHIMTVGEPTTTP